MKKYLDRHSVRSYTDQKISTDIKEKLINVINESATSFNGQAFSAIWIENNEIKNKISENNWQQKHIIDAPVFILFVADLRRVVKSGEKTKQDLSHWLHSDEALLTATVDCTIAATSIVNASSELGLGSCFIGGVRIFTEKLVEWLDLPEYVLPILGVIIGYEDVVPNPKHKPKVNKVYMEKYNQLQFTEELESYNSNIKHYYNLRFVNGTEKKDGNDYYRNTGNTTSYIIYKNNYKTLTPTIKKQKFLLTKK